MTPLARMRTPVKALAAALLISSLTTTPLIAQENGNLEKKELSPQAQARLLQDLEAQVEQRRAEIAREEEKLAATKAALEAVKRELRMEHERLEAIRLDVEAQIARRDTVVDERLDDIASFYKAMKPKEASKALEGMEDDMAVAILERLPGRTVGKIFDTMPKDRVRELTRRLEEGRK